MCLYAALLLLYYRFTTAVLQLCYGFASALPSLRSSLECVYLQAVYMQATGKLLVYQALIQATSVSGLKLLVYEALSY